MGALNAGLAQREATAWRTTAAAYLSLTKPRIISLLLITTVPAMVVAQQGWPSTWLVVATLMGGTLAAGGANAINCYLDRDIDRLMHRTRQRPLPLGRIEPQHALMFALTLEAAAFLLLALTSNVLAGTLAITATAFYVFVYTLWLKRTSRQNIVIGGAAGAMPPLVGWAAVTGDVGMPAVVLFLVVFFWTPPHFWALSIKYRDDYARANVPMMPVVATLDQTKAQMFWYAVLLAPVSLSLLATGAVGWVYGASAALLGVGFIWQTWRLRQTDDPGAAMGVFKYSIWYLSALFCSLLLDRALLG